MIKAVVFDLDGVLVDTVEAHYQGWRAVAAELGLNFSRSENDRLRGVPRAASLRLLAPGLSQAESDRLLELKARVYLQAVRSNPAAVVIPGVEALVRELRAAGLAIAVASASKHARELLDLTGLASLADMVSDGHFSGEGKPRPGQLLDLAARLGRKTEDCLLVEDSESGLRAAAEAGMPALGIGPAIDRTVWRVPWLPSLRNLAAPDFWKALDIREDARSAEQGKELF